MNLDDFTSPTEVRAVLGVSDEELEDSTLELVLYWQNLQLELESVHPLLESMYTSIYQATASTRTIAQQKLVNIVQVFSAYATSKSLLGSSTLFAPKKITDGRAAVERFDHWDILKDEIEQTLQALRARLIAALTALDVVFPVAVGRTFLGRAPLSINPITNLR